MSSMIHDAADRLLAGKEGSEVVDYLREELHASAERGGRAFSVNTLKNYVSRTKALVLDRDYRNKDCDFQPLRAFDNPDVNYFLAATLKTQVQIQRKHRSPFSEPTWTDEMETALQGLSLLPANMETFKITEREVRQIKRADKTNLRQRMDHVVSVDGAVLLARATELLHAAAVTDSYVTLLAPLLLVSGRREIEILNTCSGRSSFEKAGERSVLFTGQAKTKSDNFSPYTIPLLCEADVFLYALAVLKTKRGDLSLKTNEEIHAMMNGNFTPAYLHQVFPMLPAGVRWHLLRSLYLGCVFQCFNHTLAVNRLGKLVLGHWDESESLRYLCTRVEGVGGLKFGLLV